MDFFDAAFLGAAFFAAGFLLGAVFLVEADVFLAAPAVFFAGAFLVEAFLGDLGAAAGVSVFFFVDFLRPSPRLNFCLVCLRVPDSTAFFRAWRMWVEESRDSWDSRAFLMA